MLRMGTGTSVGQRGLPRLAEATFLEGKWTPPSKGLENLGHQVLPAILLDPSHSFPASHLAQTSQPNSSPWLHTSASLLPLPLLFVLDVEP